MVVCVTFFIMHVGLTIESEGRPFLVAAHCFAVVALSLYGLALACKKYGDLAVLKATELDAVVAVVALVLFLLLDKLTRVLRNGLRAKHADDLYELAVRSFLHG